MSNAIQLKIGSIVPVILQLFDGNTGVYPQAVIYDDDDNLLTTLDLVHKNNGLYAPSSQYTMPDEDYISITYIVYTDASHTTESSTYLRELGLFKNAADTIGAVWDELVQNHTITDSLGYEALVDAYNSKVHIDVAAGASGTSYPYGTKGEPVNNISDALTIAALYNLHNLHINDALTISGGEDISGYSLLADRSLGNSVSITNAVTDETYFEDLTVNGTMNGSVRYTTSVLGVIINFDGGAKNCLLTGNITVTGTGDNYFTDVDVYVTDFNAYIEIDIGSQKVNLIRCRGNYEITNKTSTDTTSIDLVAGKVKIASSCVSGTIEVSGTAEVVDESGSGCTVQINSMSHEAISKNVWDEALTGAYHNLPTSAGRRLRALSTHIITEGSVVSATANTVVLDGVASSDDGAYDPAVISITEGTGYGQSRLILQYKGSTKTAVIDRDWKTLPDTSSVYAISADPGREHVNEGKAQGGTSNTITLNTLASSVDNVYIGQTIFLRSGTGQDQACKVTAYNGTTKVVTACKDWEVIPDDTTGYVIIAAGYLSVVHLAAKLLELGIASEATAELSAVATAFLEKIIMNKREIKKNGSVWELIVYDDDDTTPILNKALKNLADTDITDLAIGVMAKENASSV